MRGLALLLLAACASPHWEGEVRVRVEPGGPPWAALAVSGAVQEYAGHGLSIRVAEPANVFVTWGTPPHVGQTHLGWGLDGEVESARIVMRRDLGWSNGEPCSDGFDLQTAVTHELGHALGIIGHSSDPAAVMYREVPFCPTTKRRLTPADLEML